MPNQPISLTVLHPCTRTWNSLESVPSDRTRRYCDECDLHVRNVSELSDDQAHQLMITPGRVCISGICKSDGILLTKSRLREEVRIQLRRRPLLRIAAALGLISIPTALMACNRNSITPAASASPTRPQEASQNDNPMRGTSEANQPQAQPPTPIYCSYAGTRSIVPPAPCIPPPPPPSPTP